jgi:hypothetical protein
MTEKPHIWRDRAEPVRATTRYYKPGIGWICESEVGRMTRTGLGGSPAKAFADWEAQPLRKAVLVRRAGRYSLQSE